MLNKTLYFCKQLDIIQLSTFLSLVQAIIIWWIRSLYVQCLILHVWTLRGIVSKDSAWTGLVCARSLVRIYSHHQRLDNSKECTEISQSKWPFSKGSFKNLLVASIKLLECKSSRFLIKVSKFFFFRSVQDIIHRHVTVSCTFLYQCCTV